MYPKWELNLLCSGKRRVLTAGFPSGFLLGVSWRFRGEFRDKGESGTSAAGFERAGEVNTGVFSSKQSLRGEDEEPVDLRLYGERLSLWGDRAVIL